MPGRIRIAIALLVLVAGPLPARAVGGPEATASGASLEVYDPLYAEDLPEDEGLEHDPLEPANRWTFAFNEGLDRWVLDPLTEGYQFLVPAPARRGVNRFFDNLNSPVIFANEVLQLRPGPAANTFGRFAINSTLGVAGIFDIAGDLGNMRPGRADFGQTLARYGMPRGPYLVVPIFGPSTARDALGTIVDQALDPLTYIVGPLNLQWQLILGSGQGLALREENQRDLDALREASIDFYAALRSAYLQSRRAMELQVTGADPFEVEGERAAPDPAPDQDSSPDASFSMRSSMAAMSASKSSRLTMPENSERRSASSLTVPSR